MNNFRSKLAKDSSSSCSRAEASGKIHVVGPTSQSKLYPDLHSKINPKSLTFLDDACYTSVRAEITRRGSTLWPRCLTLSKLNVVLLCLLYPPPISQRQFERGITTGDHWCKKI